MRTIRKARHKAARQIHNAGPIKSPVLQETGEEIEQVRVPSRKVTGWEKRVPTTVAAALKVRRKSSPHSNALKALRESGAFNWITPSSPLGFLTPDVPEEFLDQVRAAISASSVDMSIYHLTIDRWGKEVADWLASELGWKIEAASRS